MILRLGFLLCLVASVCTVGLPASGDQGPARLAEAAPPDPAAVAADVRRGDKARLAGRWSEAALAYANALAGAERAGLTPEKRAPILGELGLSELALGKHRDAAEHIYLSLKNRGALSPDQRWRYEQGQKKVEREVGMLFIGVDPPDAEVLVDAKPLAARKSSHVVFVEPGKHTVRARLAGYVDEVVSLDAPKGSWPSVSLQLEQKPSPPIVAATAPRAPSANPAPRGSSVAAKLRTAGFITAGAGAVLGVGFTVAAVVLDNQIEKRSAALSKRAAPRKGEEFSVCLEPTHKQDCDTLVTMADTRKVLGGAAVGSFITSAAIGAAAFSSFWWAPREYHREPIRITPLATMTHAGAVVTGAW